jgi:hypothetical protein
MVVGGAVGSAADLLYGYMVACVQEKERHERSKAEKVGQRPPQQRQQDF